MRKQTVFTAFTTGITFDRSPKGPQLKFLEEAMKICPSNVLIGQMVGKSNLAICNARTAAKERGVPVLDAHNFGLINAYKKYAAPLLTLAKSIPVAINHKGYQTILEVTHNLKPLQKQEQTQTTNGRYNSWTPDELKVIDKYAAMLNTGKPVDVIIQNAFEELKQFGKNRTTVGIRGKLYLQKPKTSKQQKSVSLRNNFSSNTWTEKELNILQKYVPLIGKEATARLVYDGVQELKKAGFTRTDKAVEIRLFNLRKKNVTPVDKKIDVKPPQQTLDFSKIEAMKKLGAKKITIGDMTVEF